MAEQFWFACKECKSLNYVGAKNKSKQREKMSLKKFCKPCGKHTSHVETRLRD